MIWGVLRVNGSSEREDREVMLSKSGHVLGGYHKHARSELGCG